MPVMVVRAKVTEVRDEEHRDSLVGVLVAEVFRDAEISSTTCITIIYCSLRESKGRV